MPITYVSSVDPLVVDVMSRISQPAPHASMGLILIPLTASVFNVLPIASPAKALPQPAPLVRTVSTSLEVDASPVSITVYHVVNLS